MSLSFGPVFGIAALKKKESNQVVFATAMPTLILLGNARGWDFVCLHFNEIVRYIIEGFF